MALFAFAILANAWSGFSDIAQAAFGRGVLTIHTQKGPVEVAVEIADNDDARTRGLMFRRSLGERAGMLFLFEKTEVVSMWMKNTYISLDMVFIGEDRRVVHIARNTEPLSTDVISSRFPTRWVLEIAAGEAARLGIAAGDRVELKR